jgi:ABC-type branched-subunit amino acid transport system substrate-binding protein
VLYQDDDFGLGGLAGIQDEMPAANIVSKEPYQSGTTSLATQMTALKASGAKVLVEFTVPIYTAIARLTAFKLGYAPQLVVSNVGIDPITVEGLLKSISKGKATGAALINGAITDGYLPSYSDTSNPWISLFLKIHNQYDKSAPFDGNVEYGMAAAYTLVQALEAAGKDLTRQALVNAVDNYGASWKGPGLTPFRYTKTEHGGYSGVQMAKVVNGQINPFGPVLTTSPTKGSAIAPYTTSQAAPPASGIPSS